MPKAAPVSSIAAAGPELGRRILEHKVHAFRAGMHGPDVVHEPGHLRLITGEPLPFGNFALISRPENLEEITRAAELLASCGVPAALILPGAAPEAADSILRFRGFMPQTPLPAMAVDIERIASTTLPSGYEFASVVTGEDGNAWTEAFAIGYELPKVVAEAFAPRLTNGSCTARDSLEFFVVRRTRRVVAMSMLCKHDGLAGVYCVATVPGERGKGLGGHATAEPLRRACAEGYRVGVLQSTAAGYGVYRRLGFTDFAAVPLYVRIPS